ncbi:MAG: zinc ribbon domain-containing protein [Lachnospiraceae bacterium]|nr:zinc ribbon domain-containing protein [Lachnospiraceae bacterium]
MEFFDGMAQKTKNLSEIMKLTAAVSSEKERQEKIYKELGETYYKVYGDRAESELIEMCAQIRESRETVETYEKEILALKGIAVCPACGYEVSVHFNFCNNCGHKMKEVKEEQPSVDELIQEGEKLREEEEILAEKEEEVTAEDRIVKEILEEETSAAKESVEEILAEEQQGEEPFEPAGAEEPFEPEMVTSTEEIQKPEAEEDFQGQEDPFVQEIQEAVSVSSEKTCKECGAHMEADQEFCIMCGTRYEEDKVEKEAEEEEEPQARICPNCGSIVKPGHLFCMECGMKQ